ncbi:MAG: hypothetical protein AAFV27_12880, partial [Pseudomonadota bacterium]
QLLGHEGAPLLQMAYLSEADEPFAFCVTSVDSADHAPRTELREGLATTYWVKDGVGFLVVGGADQVRTQSLGEALATTL